MILFVVALQTVLPSAVYMCAPVILCVVWKCP